MTSLDDLFPCMAPGILLEDLDAHQVKKRLKLEDKAKVKSKPDGEKANEVPAKKEAASYNFNYAAKPKVSPLEPSKTKEEELRRLLVRARAHASALATEMGDLRQRVEAAEKRAAMAEEKAEKSKENLGKAAQRAKELVKPVIPEPVSPEVSWSHLVILLIAHRPF